jgi:hypothetical protein
MFFGRVVSTILAEKFLIISDFGEADFFARFLFWVATGRFATY